MCTAALLDGSTALLSLSSHSSSSSSSSHSSSSSSHSSSSSTGNDSDDKQSYERVSDNYEGSIHQSHEAVRAVTLNGLFAQKAGVPQDVSSRPVLLEILMCLNRLTKCFSPLNAVHLSICNRRRVLRERMKENVGTKNSIPICTKAAREGVGQGDKTTNGVSNLSNFSRSDEDIFYNRENGGNDGQSDQFDCLKERIQFAYKKLITAWQLGVNALGRYFIGESAAHGQTDSQLSLKPFSQHLSQSQSQRNKTNTTGYRSVLGSASK